MFAAKNKIYLYLTIAFLALFALGQTVSLVHNFSHKIEKTSKEKHDIFNCALCSAFSFQNNLALFNLASFSALIFFLAAIFMVANRQKLLLFKSNNPTRAPPYFS
jgi:hypothetical protein